MDQKPEMIAMDPKALELIMLAEKNRHEEVMCWLRGLGMPAFYLKTKDDNKVA